MNLANEIRSYSQKLKQQYGGRYLPTDEEGYLNINIVFLDQNKREDETQFDIFPENFDYISGKCPELVSLWEGFCKENGFDVNSVQDIYINRLE